MAAGCRATGRPRPLLASARLSPWTTATTSACSGRASSGREDLDRPRVRRRSVHPRPRRPPWSDRLDPHGRSGQPRPSGSIAGAPCRVPERWRHAARRRLHDAAPAAAARRDRHGELAPLRARQARRPPSRRGLPSHGWSPGPRRIRHGPRQPMGSLPALLSLLGYGGGGGRFPRYAAGSSRSRAGSSGRSTRPSASAERFSRRPSPRVSHPRWRYRAGKLAAKRSFWPSNPYVVS